MIPSYRLVMRSGPTVGTTFPLDRNELFVGRDLTNDIVINDPEVSRRHARFFVQGANFVLEDLGSTNGTTVNGQRLMGPYILRPGELIVLGENISLLFESTQPELDATIAATGSQAMHTVQASQPSYSPPPPPPTPIQRQPVYSGQIPQAADPEPPKKGKKVWLIVIIVVLLMMICVCVAVLWYIDANYMWCDLFGWALGSDACPTVP